MNATALTLKLGMLNQFIFFQKMNVTKKRKCLFFVSMIHFAKTFHTPKTTI